MANGATLIVGTRKGLWICSSDASRSTWATRGPVFLGHVVHHAVLDPRDRRTLLMATSTGHLGPTVLRSDDLGETWNEADAPPAFPADDRLARTVRRVFWLTPGHVDDPGVWYAGGTPQGLFRSD